MSVLAKRVTAFSGLLAATLASFLLIGCEDKLKPAVSPDAGGRELPSQESWDTRIIFSDSGRTKAILHAGHIAAYEEKRMTMLDSNITIDFFDRSAHHTSTLTAKKGKVDDINHNLEAYDHVIVRSDSGTTLTTEHLYWDNNRQLIHTPLYVEIVSPTEQIQGNGLESDESLKHYTIQKVTGKANVKQADNE